RRHPAAERGVEHVGCVSEPMRLADTGAADADVRLLELLFPVQHQRPVHRRREFFDLAVTGDAAEQARTFRGETLVLDLAGGGDKDAAGAVARRHERSQLLVIYFIYRLDRAENRQRERMTFPEIFGEQVVDEIVGSVLGLRDFLQYDLALALYFGGIENR